MKMRAIIEAQRPQVEFALGAANDRLVGAQNSPLILGMVTGMVRIADSSEDTPFAFVSDIRTAPDFKEEGFPPELWLAFASYLEELASGIREGKYDVILQPQPEPKTEDMH